MLSAVFLINPRVTKDLPGAWQSADGMARNGGRR